MVIGAIWINHHAMFHHIIRVDETLLLLNVLHLMLIAFLSFPTAVLAEAFHRGTDEPIAAAFYGEILTVIGIFVNVIWRYASRGGRLLSSHITAQRYGNSIGSSSLDRLCMRSQPSLRWLCLGWRCCSSSSSPSFISGRDGVARARPCLPMIPR